MKEVNKFYLWMLRIKNIHTGDNEAMNNAFNTIYEQERRMVAEDLARDKSKGFERANFNRQTLKNH